MTLRTSDRFVVTWRTHSGRLTDPKFFGELASAEAAAEDLRGQSNVIADSVEVEERPAVRVHRVTLGKRTLLVVDMGDDGYHSYIA